jgi:preprotein translocase subunit YajC
MFDLVPTAGLLAAATPGQVNPIIQFAPLVLIFVVFYFMLIRPQQQRLKTHKEMIAALRRGDVVVTGGGFIGKIVRVNEQGDEVTVELAENVRVKVLKSTISEVRAKTEPVKGESGKTESGKGESGKGESGKAEPPVANDVGTE